MAEESCDHSGAFASSLLMELRDLQGDVDQRSQHDLDDDIRQRRNLLWLLVKIMPSLPVPQHASQIGVKISKYRNILNADTMLI